VDRIEGLLGPVLNDIRDRAAVAGRFIDKDLYRINLATLWANLVLNPEDVGLTQPDLETAHDFISAAAEREIGCDLRACYAFVGSKSGEQAMAQARLGTQHRELLLYFASMILDPDGHRRWMDTIRADLERPGQR
jgi:hypothetical protein